MSNNGKNTWDVRYSLIASTERFLKGHKNVASVTRHDDLVFEIDRKRQGDHLRLFCCREYTMSLTSVLRAAAEFGELDIIYIGGNWNGYTREAKAYCLEAKIGLYNSSELAAALFKDQLWTHIKKDSDGKPEYSYREE